jgi:hypothetical protein
MRNSYKVLTAVAVAGLALAGGSAFTGAGVTASGNAASAGFVGGTVSQTITGADLAGVTYGYTGNGTVTSVKLDFTLTSADDKTVTASLTGGSGTDLTCPGVVTLGTITCTTVGYTGATKLDVGVV